MKVSDILKNKDGMVITTTPESKLLDAVKILFDNKIGAIIIQENNRGIIGILTERDILRECATRYLELESLTVQDSMSTDIVFALQEDSLEYIASVMHKKKIRHLPVLSSEKVLLGILSIRDIVEENARHLEAEVRHLREYMSQ